MKINSQGIKYSKIKTKIYPFPIYEEADWGDIAKFTEKFNNYLEDLDVESIKIQKVNNSLALTIIRYRENLKLKLARKLCQ